MWLGSATAYARMRHFKRFSLSRRVLPRDLSSWWQNGNVGGIRFGFQPVTRSRKHMNKDVTPGRTSLQTSPNTTESSTPSQSGSKDINFKQGQPWDTPSSPKSSWQAVGTCRANLEALGNSGYLGLWWNIGSTMASKKHVCAITFTQSSIVPFPIVWNCRTLTMRYYQFTTKTSHSNEMVLQRGWKKISKLF